MAHRDHEQNDVEIRADDEGSGAIVSFPFDVDLVERFRSAFPRARWSERLEAWRLPGETAVRRATRWLDRELPADFSRADERGRDSFSFEPIVSPYLTVADELVICTPYSRTVVEELRAVPWAWWNGEEKAWQVPFRSVDELRKRWPAIEAAAKRNEPEARKQRYEAAKAEPGYEQAKLAISERRRHRYPVPAAALPPLDGVLMSHDGPLVIIEITGEVVPDETAQRHYAWSSPQHDLVWAIWRRPTFDELVKTWPAKRPPTSSDLVRGWWQPTPEELRPARKAARSRTKKGLARNV
ncbi:hypothetical protein ACWIGM_05290 [Bosea sp. NPDC055332]